MAYIDNLYKQGFEALSLGLPERAIPLFEKVLAIDNKNPNAMVGRARALTLQGQCQKALIDFARALNINEQHVDAIAYRARVHLMMDQTSEAQADIDTALSMDPGHPGALATRAQMQTDFQLALSDFDNAIVRDSQNPELYYLRANLLEANGMDARALTDFRQVVQLRPDGFRDAKLRVKKMMVKIHPEVNAMELVPAIDPPPQKRRSIRRRAVGVIHDVDDFATRFESWLKKHLPQSLNSLNAGASNKQIRELEKELDVVLPEEFKAFYTIHDGQQEDESLGIFFGIRPLPLEEIAREWTQWKELLESEDLDIDDSSSAIRSFPPKAIRVQAANLKWIPFTHDYSGNHIGIDLDPGPRGTVGQVINFGTSEHPKFVLAKSFGEFLQRILVELETGNFRIDGDEDFVLRRRPNVQFFEYLFVLSGSGIWTPSD